MSLTNPTSPNEQLLSVNDIARLAGLSGFTVSAWVAKNDVPHQLIGGCRYFSPTVVSAELALTGLPLHTSLKQVVAEISGGITDLTDLSLAYVLDARAKMPRIKLPNGKVFYTSFGVAWALQTKNPVYLNPPEAAELLGLHRTTVLRMAIRGELPSIRLLGTNKRMIDVRSVLRQDTDGWLRTSEVAAQWHMSQSAVHRLCRQGKLESVLVGNQDGGFYLINPDSYPAPPQHPITTQQFAEALGVTRRAVEAWYNKGLIKGARLGHNLRFAKSEIKQAKRRGLGTRRHQRA